MKRQHHINVALSKATLDGLHELKTVMGARGQAEVIQTLVAIGRAIHSATKTK